MGNRVSFRRRAAALLAGGLAVTAAASAGGAGPEGAPLRLVCTAAPGVPQAQLEALCAAMQADLQARLAALDPPRRVERADPPPDSPTDTDADPAGATGPAETDTDTGALVRVTVLRAASHHITAELFWQDGAQSGAAPALSSLSVDGTLKPAWYASLSRNLLETSGFGIPAPR